MKERSRKINFLKNVGLVPNKNPRYDFLFLLKIIFYFLYIIFHFRTVKQEDEDVVSIVFDFYIIAYTYQTFFTYCVLDK